MDSEKDEKSLLTVMRIDADCGNEQPQVSRELELEKRSECGLKTIVAGWPGGQEQCHQDCQNRSFWAKRGLPNGASSVSYYSRGSMTLIPAPSMLASLALLINSLLWGAATCARRLLAS
jgi:hypothetical protein